MNTLLQARTLLALICGLFLGTLAAGLVAAEEPVIVENADDIWDAEGAEWPRWSAHDHTSKRVLDYSVWARFMEDFSDPTTDRGALDYTRIVAKGMGHLSEMIHALQEVPVSRLNRDEQLAYWLNLHNAAAVWRTANSLPLEDDAVRSLVMGERWREKTLQVEGEAVSLVDIARRIVMRQWKDPRVLYGLYIPAHGAPSLPRKSFTGATVWQSLDQRARDFVNSDRALEIHGETLHVSALYFWDRLLFADETAVIAHLESFAAPPLKVKLKRFRSVAATYLNWRVNSFNSGYDPNQDRRTGS